MESSSTILSNILKITAFSLVCVLLKSETTHSDSMRSGRNLVKLTSLDVNSKRFDSRLPDSPASLSGNQVSAF